MPVARLHIPVVSGQNGVAGAGGEVEDFQSGVVGGREEFAIAWGPGKISNGIVVCVVNCLNIVEVWPPVFDITSLPTRDQPILAMRPAERCHACLNLIIMGLSQPY